MGWLYIKRKDKPQIHYVTEESYESIFKAQGFEIVDNSKNIQPISKNQLNKNLNIQKAVKNEQLCRKAKVKNT